MDHLLLAFPSVAVGFIAGLVTFQRKQRWCQRCGATLTCPLPRCDSLR